VLRFFKILLLILIGFFLSIWSLKSKSLPVPFVWISSLWCVIFLLSSILTSRPFIKIICFNIAAISLILGIFEAYFWHVELNKIQARQFDNKMIRIHEREKIIRDKNLVVKDNILGYSYIPDNKTKVTKYSGEALDFDVEYTIDENGLRISPPTKADTNQAILFFGCSFTFGEGVNDNETMPYVVGTLTDGEYSIYNFGASGYGAQQMLAAIDHGLVNSSIKEIPKYAIYFAIPDHVRRLTDTDPKNYLGPHYELNKNGEIVSVSSIKYIWPRIKIKLYKSYLYRTIDQRVRSKIRSGSNIKLQQTEIETFAAILEKSKHLLELKYPGIEFHVLFWNIREGDYSETFSNEILKTLIRRGLKTHQIASLIKPEDYSDTARGYKIPHDVHPTALSYRIIADYVVKEIINK
jgi:hypothetical protein